MEYSDSLMLIISDNLIIEDINPAAEKVLGWNKQEVCGKKILEVFETKSTQPFIDVPPPLLPEERSTEVIRNKKIHKISWKIIPNHGKDSKYLSFFITGKERTELNTKQLENLQIENVVKYAPSFFYWKDCNSVYQGCNDEFARLAGLQSSEEVKGKTDFDLIWKDRATLYVEIDQMVLNTGKARLNHEEIITISDNRTITAITNKVPLLDDENNIIGILGITTDITDLKQAKERAEVANHAKTQFIANMSHDIRTPLTGVIGMSKIMEDKTKDLEEKQYAHWVNESGKQLLSLLNGILDVISAENVNDDDLINETFDLHRCIQDIAELELPTIKLKNLDLIIDIPENIPQHLVSDRTKLHRILLNLVGNSIKFTEKGHISIKVSLLEQIEDTVRLQFSVVDTGIGIPEEMQSKVFDRFFRVNPSYKGVYKGHGIGLHIAQSYVDLLGGEIKLTSKVNHGTTFYFDLLLQIGHPEELTHSDSGTLKGIEEKMHTAFLETKDLKNQSVNIKPDVPYLLLVEDSPIALKMLQIAATSAGCRYESAEDALLALDLAKTAPFDLIVTDIGLPGMSGIELTTAIRKWEKTNQKMPVPIVGLTAHSGDSETQQCLQAGMNKILIKPATFKLIQSIVKEFIVHHESVPASSLQNKKPRANLPSKEHLLTLSHFPVLDTEKGVVILGNEQLLKDMLTLMLHHGIDEDKQKIEQAYSKKNWDKVQELAHKMKGGASYCGMVQLQMACEYLERYPQNEHSSLPEQLYNQVISTIDITKQYVTKWLKDHQ